MHEDGNNERAKGAAIIAGYLKQSVERGIPGTLSDAAGDFATLIAALTSPVSEIRKTAKETVRSYALAGSWKAQVPAKAKTEPKNQAVKPKETEEKAAKKPFRWTREEEEKLLTTWNKDQARDADTVRRISEEFRRSHLAVIIRLYQMGGIGMDKGDDLCRLIGTAKLLSECEAASSNSR